MSRGIQFGMSTGERVVLAVLFLGLAVPMAYVKNSKWVEGYGDTAMLGQATQSVATRGLPLVQSTPSIEAFMNRQIASLPAKVACNVDLTTPLETEENFFRVHTYLILYLIAPLTWILPVSIIWSTLTVAVFLGLVFATYIFLRNGGVPIVASALFGALVTVHPVWSQGLYFWQPYVDRLFLLLGGLFIFAVVARHLNRHWVILFGVLSALLLERVGIVIGVFAVGYTLLYWRKRQKDRYFLLVCGMGFVIFSYIVVRIFVNDYYSNYGGYLPVSWDDLLLRLATPEFRNNLDLFLIVNLGVFGLLSLFDLRALALAVVIMSPNMIGSIGGAEKTGWSTHYHSLYFPFLMWAAASGFIYLFRTVKPRIMRLGLYTLPALGILIFGTMNPPFTKADLQEYSLTNFFGNNAVLRSFSDLPLYLDSTRRYQVQMMQTDVGGVIPEGSSVSGPESVFPSLYEHHTLYIYPIGMDVADYAIPQVISSLGADNQALLTECLRNRMSDAGYDMLHPIYAGSMDIYRRTAAANVKPPNIASAGEIVNDFETSADLPAVQSDTGLVSATLGLNNDPIHISSGEHSLQKTFLTDSKTGVHYGGVTLYGINALPFTFDFWMDSTCPAQLMLVIPINEKGQGMGQYTRDLTTKPMAPGKRETLSFLPGASSSGFVFSSGQQSGKLSEAAILLDVRQPNCAVTFYLDALRNGN
jgi:hypothetical protein